MRIVTWLGLSFLAMKSSVCHSVEIYSGRVPDEFESTAGNSLGFGNSGSAATGGISAVRLNPAMLALEKQYRVSAGYHWPSFGRDFYQAGVVDSSTANFAAGVLYTSSQDDYEDSRTITSDKHDEFELRSYKSDSSIRKRVSLGMARQLEKVSIGISGQHVEASAIDEDPGSTITGNTFGAGLAGLVTPTLRFSVSTENLGNRKVKDYSPRTHRVGLAYLLGGIVSLNLDYRDRERVKQETPYRVGDLDPRVAEEPLVAEEASEKMVLPSFSVQIYDALRLLGSYGHEVSGQGRRSASGGVALVNEKFTVSYLVSNPYMNDTSELHQALNLGLNVSM